VTSTSCASGRSCWSPGTPPGEGAPRWPLRHLLRGATSASHLPRPTAAGVILAKRWHRGPRVLFLLRGHQTHGKSGHLLKGPHPGHQTQGKSRHIGDTSVTKHTGSQDTSATHTGSQATSPTPRSPNTWVAKTRRPHLGHQTHGKSGHLGHTPVTTHMGSQDTSATPRSPNTREVRTPHGPRLRPPVSVFAPCHVWIPRVDVVTSAGSLSCTHG